MLWPGLVRWEPFSLVTLLLLGGAGAMQGVLCGLLKRAWVGRWLSASRGVMELSWDGCEVGRRVHVTTMSCE